MEIASFVIAVCGFALASGSLGWTIASWILTGGRARASLSVGFIEPISQRYALFPLPDKSKTQAQIDHCRREMQSNQISGKVGYFIEAHNRGRTSVWVRSVKLRAVTKGHEATGTTTGLDWGDKTPKRLEPGEAATFGMEAEFLHQFALVVLRKHAQDSVEFYAEIQLGTGKTAQSRERALIRADMAEIAELYQQY